MKTNQLHLYFGGQHEDHIQYKSFRFAAGERQFQLTDLEKDDWAILNGVTLYFKYSGDSSLIELMMAINALRNVGATKINLFIPYFPGARQDRICNPGEAFSLKMYAEFINNLKCNRVHVFDPHSDVTPALIENVVIHKNWEFVAYAMRRIKLEMNNSNKDMVLVSPDAGANKKVFDLTKFLGGIPVIRADKLRDVTNGKILETVVYAEDLTGKIAIITDDICSYGGTFKALAKKLKEKNAEKVYLVVSHFEGVANLRELKESGIDGVYTTDSFPLIESDDYNKDGFIKIQNIWSVM